MRALLAASLLLAIAATAAPRPAAAEQDCTIRCTERDKSGKCTKQEKICVDKPKPGGTPGGGVNVPLPQRDCYECTEWKGDICTKTRKVKCPE